MVDELFGPVVTIYVYREGELEDALTCADTTSPYALTCGL
jgi:acyl-CoA reductase-like NAD-dependent aldehyde dehydrogenase